MPATITASTISQPVEGILWCPGLVSGALAERWAVRASSLYLSLDTARDRGDLSQINRVVPSGQKLALTASSFTLGALLNDSDLQVLGRVFKHGPAGGWLREQLGSGFTWDLARSWVRRQYAPGRYPRWHAPHAWHQDGALGFDFFQGLLSGARAAAPMEMVTCWIALNACGTDSPGLEFVTCDLDRLLRPAELTRECLAQSFSPQGFWRPAFQAGDALLFRGGVPHRTHVDPGMTGDRTSIELRFFPEGRGPKDTSPGLSSASPGPGKAGGR